MDDGDIYAIVPGLARYVNIDSPGPRVAICRPCFRYSKFPEQWREEAVETDWRCSSCGLEYVVVMVRAREDSERG